jgi:hypothetical protein
VTPAKDVHLYLIQRRGKGGPDDRAMIVGAVSEAHARVAAYERSKDVAWVEHAAITRIVPEDGVLHTIYAGGAA